MYSGLKFAPISVDTIGVGKDGHGRVAGAHRE